MSPLVTDARPAPPRGRGGVAAAVVATVVAVAMFFALAPALKTPPTVGGVTIANPHVWHVEVAVGPPDGSRWIGLGHVGREQSRTFDDVIDAGHQWVFRFAHPGIETVSLVLSRRDLEHSRWTVSVPDEFARRLRAVHEGPSALE